MLLLKSMYILFFFFTHKQIYSWKHFTGASAKARLTLYVVGLISLLFELLFLIYIATISTIVSSLILLVVSIICLFILNTCTSIIGMRQALRERANNELLLRSEIVFRGCYEYKCDIVSTLIASIGIIFNAVFMICFVTFIL